MSVTRPPGPDQIRFVAESRHSWKVLEILPFQSLPGLPENSKNTFDLLLYSVSSINKALCLSAKSDFGESDRIIRRGTRGTVHIIVHILTSFNDLFIQL